MIFVDIDKEISRLERALNDEERSRFVVIYGRRRLGKSTLIRHILRDTDVYYMADMTEQSQQIAMLSKIIAYKFEGFDQVIYPDWDSLIPSFFILGNFQNQYSASWQHYRNDSQVYF